MKAYILACRLATVLPTGVFAVVGKPRRSYVKAAMVRRQIIAEAAAAAVDLLAAEGVA